MYVFDFTGKIVKVFSFQFHNWHFSWMHIYISHRSVHRLKITCTNCIYFRPQYVMIKPISIEELPMPKGIPSLLQPRGVYRCHFCEKTYKQHAALRRHYQTKHDYHIWNVSAIFFLFAVAKISLKCYILRKNEGILACTRFRLLSWFIDMNMWIEMMMEYCGMRKNFYLLQYSYIVTTTFLPFDMIFCYPKT